VEKKGGDKGGRVTGGSVSAAQGIELHIAGSESNPRTMLVLQADPKTKAELDKLERTVKLCDENITKIMRTMGLKKFDPGAIKLMMARVPPAKREIYVKILEQLSQLMKKWRSNSSEADQLNKKVEKELRQVEIQVRQAVFPRVEVQIGTRKFPVSEDLGPTVFCLKDNKVVIKK